MSPLSGDLEEVLGGIGKGHVAACLYRTLSDAISIYFILFCCGYTPYNGQICLKFSPSRP